MLTLTTRTDIHGNPVSGSPAAVDRYDAAVDHLLAYRNDLLDTMTSLATDEPDFPMGQLLAAYLSLTSTDLPDVAGARQIAAHLEALTLNEREAAHRSVLDTWLAGDWHGAARRLDSLLIRWPADLLGLLVGHQLDFFLGDAANLRDRVGRSLPAIDPAHPHHGYVRGMYAFGLEESGNYQLAERHGLAAVERNRDDVWATHAVVHTYEMQGRVDDGIRFLQGPQADWAEGNLFTVHNWWHLAIYLLEAGRSDESLSIYDQQIHNEHSAGVPLEMLDASALLWRAHLDGIDVDGRFAPLADAWATRTSDEPWYVFNDLHAVMALAGAGRLNDARAVVDRLAAYVATAGAVLQRPHDRRGRPARLPVGGRPRRGTPRRRHRRPAAGPDDPRPLRRVARPARRAPAHTRRLGDEIRRARSRPRAARRTTRRARDERLVVAAPRPSLRRHRRCQRGRARRAASRGTCVQVRRRRSLSPRQSHTVSCAITPSQSARQTALVHQQPANRKPPCILTRQPSQGHTAGPLHAPGSPPSPSSRSPRVASRSPQHPTVTAIGPAPSKSTSPKTAPAS